MPFFSRRISQARTLLLLLVWPPFAFGCSADSGDPSRGDRILNLDLDPLYTVGRMDGEAWEEFRALTSAAFGPDGRLYLLDGPGDRGVVVDSSGRFLAGIGSPGEGPGEFRTPVGIVVTDEGSVFVWDSRKRAFLRFDPEGKFLEEIRPGFEAGLPDGRLTADSEGRILAAARRMLANGRHSYATEDGIAAARDGIPIIRVDPEEEGPAVVVASLPMPLWTGPGDPPSTRAFEPDPTWGLLTGDLLALHFSDEYEIHLVKAGGEEVAVIRRELEPRPTSTEDREAFRRDWLRRYSEGEIWMASAGQPSISPDERARRMMEEAHFHEVISPVVEVRTDGRHHIWVQRRSPEDPTRPGPVDIFSLEDGYVDGYVGTLLGEDARIPDAFGPGGRVVYLEEGEMGVPLARVYRLQPDFR